MQLSFELLLLVAFKHPHGGDQSRAAAARCVAGLQPALLHAHQAAALTLGRQHLEQRQQVQA